MSEFFSSPAEEVPLQEIEGAVERETFFEPGFDKPTRRYDLAALKRACEGQRFDEDAAQFTATGRRLPHWDVDWNLQPINPDGPCDPSEVQGLAVVVSESEGKPAIIEYFDGRGIHIGRKFTTRYSSHALGSDGAMHRMQFRYDGWAVSGSGQVERMWQTTLWENGRLEVVERSCEGWEVTHLYQMPPNK